MAGVRSHQRDCQMYMANIFNRELFAKYEIENVINGQREHQYHLVKCLTLDRCHLMFILSEKGLESTESGDVFGEELCYIPLTHTHDPLALALRLPFVAVVVLCRT